jgi:hypothetical protein
MAQIVGGSGGRRRLRMNGNESILLRPKRDGVSISEFTLKILTADPQKQSGHMVR